MSNFRKGIFYAAYVLATTFFFVYFLFPSDAVKQYVSNRVSVTYPELDIDIDRISPAFPPGLKFRVIRLQFQNDLQLNIDQIKIVPGLLSLLGSKVNFTFKARAYAGLIKVKGAMTKSRTAPQTTIDARLSDIRIKEVSALQELVGRKISGRLDGKVKYDVTIKSGENLDAQLSLTDSELVLLTPVFNLDKFSFSKIEADIHGDFQKLIIKKCDFKGSQFNGTFSGFVNTKSPVNKSVLNLSGTVAVQKAFLAKLDSVFPGYTKSAERGINVKFSGTLEEPKYSFNFK
jgi:type II secretion system protein N